LLWFSSVLCVSSVVHFCYFGFLLKSNDYWLRVTSKNISSEYVG
jgi:hypothetical protein